MWGFSPKIIKLSCGAARQGKHSEIQLYTGHLAIKLPTGQRVLYWCNTFGRDCRFVPNQKHVRERITPQMVPKRDLDIGETRVWLWFTAKSTTLKGNAFRDVFGFVFFEGSLPQHLFLICRESRKRTTKPSLFSPMSEKMQPDASLITFKQLGSAPLTTYVHLCAFIWVCLQPFFVDFKA